MFVVFLSTILYDQYAVRSYKTKDHYKFIDLTSLLI